jgi:PST family polysaccharide transporter
MIQSYQAIEQSKNQFRFSFYAIVGALIVKMILTYPLTYLFSIDGASLSTIIALSYALGYFGRQSKRPVNVFWKEDRFVIKLGMCLLVMIFALTLYRSLLPDDLSRVQALIACIIGVVVGAGFFLAATLKFRLLTVREWLLLPKGKKILEWMRGKNEIR